MTRVVCPGDVELSRAVGAGEPDPSLAAHVAGCARCRDTVEGLGRAIRVARQLLPAPVPPARHRDEVKSALLATAAARGLPGARRWPRRAAALAGAAAIAAAAAVLVTRPRAPEQAAAPAPPMAEPPRSEPRDPPRAAPTADAVADPLERGSVRLAAASKARMPARAAREPGRTAREPGRMARASETTGRPPSARPIRADGWLPVATAGAPRARGPSMPAATDAEAAYNDAWDAMRASDFRRAAAGFARVLALGPGAALGDDCAYWRAVALARASDTTLAIDAFRDMLRAYPSSPRRGQAAAMLGWLLVDARQLDEAALRFRAATADPNEAVRTSAGKGLAALAR